MNKLIVLCRDIPSEACLNVLSKLDDSDIPYELVNEEEAFEKNYGFHSMNFPVTILLDHNGRQLDWARGFDVPVIDRLISQL